MKTVRKAFLAALPAILILSATAWASVSGYVGFGCTDGTLGERTRVLVQGASVSDVTLPLEAFSFRITVQQGGTASLVLVPPAAAFDPSVPEAFVDDQGQPRNLLWLARNPDTGEWADTGAPVSVDLGLSRLTVTLTDGGAGDGDGGPNGVISVGQGIDFGDAAGPGFTGYVAPGVYPSGSVRATLEPAGALEAGAAWRVDGWGWLASGTVVPDLAAGTHYLEFRSATGYTTPTPANVTVTADTTTDRTYTYTAQTPSAPASGCNAAPGLGMGLLVLLLIPWVMAGRRH